MNVPLNTPEKTEYCSSWQHNASVFAGQGCYDWMFSQLNKHNQLRRVLDVGCGTGEGLITLLKNSVNNIVSIEENFDCIKSTESKLLDLGYNVTVIPRLGYIVGNDQRHDIMIDQDELIREGEAVTLIHGDLLLLEADTPLRNYLNSTKPFDAITTWLIGTYKMRRSCRALDNFPITEPRDYRLFLQNKVYDLAEIVLKHSGVLQIVDRGISPATKEIEDIAIVSHREQASTTSLEIVEFAHRPYTEPTKKGIKMTSFTTTNPILKDTGNPSMHSIVSVKP